MLSPRLTFHAVDDLGFAATRGMLDVTPRGTPYLPVSIGPLFELMHLESRGLLPDGSGTNWLLNNGAGTIVSAVKEDRESWIDPKDKRSGFIRAVRAGSDGDARFIAFLMAAKQAAINVTQLLGTAPGQIVAAMQELESNIHEHSEAPNTGILAFRAAPGLFEFVVVDCGIGILQSLRRCTSYSAIPDHGKALQRAVGDGVSRFGPGGNRGYGFRPIFLGLTNLYGSLRFRSGDYALSIDGTSPTLASSQVAQKPPIDGFLASICCHSTSTGNGTEGVADDLL